MLGESILSMIQSTTTVTTSMTIGECPVCTVCVICIVYVPICDEIVGCTVSTSVFASNVMKAASSAFLALSTSTTVEVLSQVLAPVHDLMAGSAYSDCAFTAALVNVFVSTGDFIGFVFIVTIVG